MNQNPGRRRLIIAAVVLLLAALLLGGGWRLHHRDASLPKPVPVASGDAVVATAPGWVDAESGLQRLGVRSEGSVDVVPVHEGDQVAASALLLRLDARQDELAQQAIALDTERRKQDAEALQQQIRDSRAQIARLEPLVSEQAEPADELRSAQAHLRDLQAQDRQLQLAIRSLALQRQIADERRRQHEIRAPAQGEVLRVLAHPGDAVAPGTPLLWFAANGPLIVRAELDERLFGMVNVGMKAEVSPEYDDSKVIEARVIRVARAVGPVQTLPELRASNKDDRVVECVLELNGRELLIGQRVLVRIMGGS